MPISIRHAESENNEEVMSLLLQGYPVADCYKQVLDRGETQGNINDIKPKKNAKKLKN
jgi:hypothetical protein